MSTAIDVADRLTHIWETPKTVRGWLSTVDHKKIGRRYLVTAMAFLLVSGIEALIIHITVGRPVNLELLSADVIHSFWVPKLELASTQGSAQEPRGAALSLERPCALCHTIRGTTARGSVAPDLTHMALRKCIAANALANEKANLAAWVTHAQALKPEVAMPNVTQFSGEELQALVAYLQQLR